MACYQFGGGGVALLLQRCNSSHWLRGHEQSAIALCLVITFLSKPLIDATDLDTLKLRGVATASGTVAHLFRHAKFRDELRIAHQNPTGWPTLAQMRMVAIIGRLMTPTRSSRQEGARDAGSTDSS